MTKGNQSGVDRIVRVLLDGESRSAVEIKTRVARWLRAVANRLSPPGPEIIRVRGGVYQIQVQGVPISEVTIDSGMLSDTRGPIRQVPG